MSYREISVNEFVKTIGWTDSLPTLFELIRSQHVTYVLTVSCVAILGLHHFAREDDLVFFNDPRWLHMKR